MSDTTTSSANDSVLLVSDEGTIRTITLNRPKAYNALTRELRLQLIDVLDETITKSSGSGSEIRAVVLRGAGKAFCTGQDLKEQMQDALQGIGEDKVVAEYNPLLEKLLAIPVPVIASIPGPAAGAGWGIAMACDIRVCADTASFKGAFSGVGLTADSGLSKTLVDAVGRARALEMLLFDEPLPADKALELGIATRVVPAAELEDEVAKLAQRFAHGPTMSFKETKALVSVAAEVAEAAAREAEAQLRLAHTKDHSAAVQAFIAKEKPNFTGE